MTQPAIACPPQPPFDPMRRGLYSPDELLAGFDPADPTSLAEAYDYRVYRYWVTQGRYRPNYFDGMMQSLHDNAMSRGVAAAIEGEKVVGIMGGHALRRDDALYAEVATLARRLTLAGYLVVSGGGPGVMEATHVGCLLANETPDAMASALGTLARKPVFPAAAGALVASDGRIDPAILQELAAWLAPALALRAEIREPGRSLGIPTWRYGHEPTAVFATQIAKYFDNSIREDGLMSIAARGIVYVRGGAGTMQEVFQAAVFNAYADDDRGPSPMIFYGTEPWRRAAVLPALRHLFGNAAFDAYVTVSDDQEAILTKIAAFDPKSPVPIRQDGAPRGARTSVRLRPTSLEPPGGLGWAI